MDPMLKFADTTEKERNMISKYLDIETNFIAAKHFFTTGGNILIRSHAVSVIAMCYTHLSRTGEIDAYIPYVAMNFFDRYISRHKMILEDVEAPTDTEKVQTIAIACLTVSAKLRNKDFSLNQFLNDIEFVRIITPEKILTTELLILHELEWEIQPLTSFTFLNYYACYFKQFAQFDPRWIYEIIIQAQGDIAFINYKPSVLAFSAFLAASKLAYHTKNEDIAYPPELANIDTKEQVEQCATYMVNLCYRLEIKIETPESGTISTSNTVMAVPQIMGNATVVFDDGEEILQISKQWAKDSTTKTSKVQVPHIGGLISESVKHVAPKMLMNFELKWLTDVPNLEILGAQSQRFTMVGVKRGHEKAYFSNRRLNVKTDSNEFPSTSDSVMKLIAYFLYDKEKEFMAHTPFFKTAENLDFRSRAVSIIAMSSSMIDATDACIPYVGMCYFDRFLSRFENILNDVEMKVRFPNNNDKAALIAICCLAIAAEEIKPDFLVDDFLRKINLMPCLLMVTRMQKLIYECLALKEAQITAFTFLNFYYPCFREFGGFNQRCIIEIIVQSQGDERYICYMPSQIALSALLAASLIAYPAEYTKIVEPFMLPKISCTEQVEEHVEQVKQCVNLMVDLCVQKSINIEIPQQREYVVARQGTSKMETSSVQVSVQDKELPDDDKLIESGTNLVDKQTLIKGKGNKDRIIEKSDDKVVKAELEALIRDALEKKNISKEQPRIIRTPFSEFQELRIPTQSVMNFGLKWTTDGVPLEETQPIQFPRNDVNFGCSCCIIL